MPDSQFDLSFIIPFYNGENFIDRLLSSITRAYKNKTEAISIEIILIIDSPNTSLDTVNSKMQTHFSNKILYTVKKNDTNIGVASSRNKGIAMAKGLAIVCIDQDDEIAKDYFLHVTKSIIQNFDFILCNGIFKFKNSSINIYLLNPNITAKNIIIYDIIRSPGQVVVKHSIISRFGFPVPQQFYGADDKFAWILIFSYFKRLSVKFVKHPLYIAHYHDNNFTQQNQQQLYRCVLELYDKILANYRSFLLPNISYINQNIKFNQYLLRRGTELRFNSYALRYYLYPNKFLSYFLKKMSKLKF